jgi:hypothetical protein
MIGIRRLKKIARVVAGDKQNARCAGAYVLTAQELIYGRATMPLQGAEWEELASFVETCARSGPSKDTARR